MRNFKSSAWEIIRFVLLTLAIVIPIRAFVAQPFIVSGASMAPTFLDREYLIVDELSFHLREPRRGEVIVFRYPQNPSKYFIKRIIGLPGETVVIKNGQVFLQEDNALRPLKVNYNPDAPSRDLEMKLDNDEYFVLGDNRTISLDSRVWGPLPKDLITGRALLRLFPLGRLSLLPGATSE